MDDERGLARLRDGFARGAGSFGGDVDILPGERWWSLSGLPSAEYNMALVHGGDVGAHVDSALEHIAEVGAPSLVMLAGRGLGGAQRLADAGWVCAGASPLMVGDRGNAWDPGPVRLRELTPGDADRVRDIVSRSYAMDPEVAAAVYSAEVLSAPGVTGYGVELDGELAAAALVHSADGLASSWALATDPALRRRGLAAGLMGAVVDAVFTADPDARLMGLTTPAAEKLYRAMGGVEAVEYWQLWSRPRWLLGSA